MKIGDLVMLSAYGMKVKRAGWVKDGDVGIVREIRGTPAWETYRVFWCNSTIKHVKDRGYPIRGASWDWCLQFDRRDLKFAK